VLDGIPEGARCYISVDIDVLDMSLIPGCVSAEPNGMSYAELRDAMFAVAERTQVIGLDLVEVNPLLDVRTGLTSYLAAHIVVESLGRICDQPWWRDARSERDAAARAGGDA
jgi:agmatinase